MRIIGIDIGNYSIKVAEIAAHKNTITLKDFYEVELNHEQGIDIRFEKVQKLKDIAAKYDPLQTKFVLALGSELVVSRVLDFPFIEKRKIIQSLPFELEDNIPLNNEQAIFDFRKISQTQNSSHVLAIAAHKKHVKEILELLDDCGIDADIISVDGIALSNLIETSEVFNQQAEDAFAVSDIYLHIGYKKTIINVTKNGALCSSRAVYFGGYDLVTNVSRAYEIPHLEALKGVKDNGFVLTSHEGADEDQIAFSQVISDGLNILISEVKRTMIDLKAENKLNYRNIFLSGGMCGLINLNAYITKETEVSCVIKHSLPSFLSSEIALSPQSEKVAAVAIGLAIEGVRKPTSPAINLRKNEFVKQSQSLKAFYEKNKSVILSSLVVFSIFFIYSFMRYSFTESNLAAIDQLISDQSKSNTLGLTKAQAKPEAIKKFVKEKMVELESKKKIIKYNQMLSAIEIMKHISSSVPSKNQIKLDITYFKINGENVSLEGTVANKDEFSLLQRKLSQVPQLSQLKIGPAPKADTGKYFFQVSMNYKRNKAKDAQ
ncbi:MAG: pilus assembly protein PilM [Oligoflexia bacterium]|nr:pilus assembly protein PilM [Oligoflexia bacterium]